jgi:hypothetical protein
MSFNVYHKLNEARQVFHQQKLSKSGHNKFAGYKYFELGDFIIPALKIFDDVGLASVIRFGKEIAEMEIINLDKPDEKIVITSPMSSAALKGCHEVQNLGAVQTYLRRYLWVAALEIVEHDAIDASEGAQSTADPKLMADHLAAIEVATTMEELKNVYIAAYASCDGDKGWQKKVMDAKEKRKGELK